MKKEKRWSTWFCLGLALLSQAFFLVSWRKEALVQHAETMAAIHALDLARQKDNEDRLHNQLESLKVLRSAKPVLPDWGHH